MFCKDHIPQCKNLLLDAPVTFFDLGRLGGTGADAKVGHLYQILKGRMSFEEDSLKGFNELDNDRHCAVWTKNTYL